MSYFNHSFQKSFVGTGGYVGDSSGGDTLNQLTTGVSPDFGFFHPDTWVGIDLGTQAAAGDCCPLVLVSASFRENDKIGKFHGGYQETHKSKIINPKYITKFYRVDNCPAQQSQVLIGHTNQDFATASCCKEFLCDSTYNLRVDIKGTPALEYLTRNAYLTVSAYTGCCDDPDAAPVAVNPLIVYIKWAYDLLKNDTINPFIEVFPTYSTDGTGSTWTAIGDGSSSAANLETLLAYTLDHSTIPSVDDCVTTTTHYAGLIINGAYVDTRFNDCTFYPSDGMKSYIEPVQIYASEVDLNGDPCEFEGLCTTTQCDAYQAKGLGEAVIREVMLTEAYRQQPTGNHKDLRIREITDGDRVFDVINRTANYTRYFIEHIVPRGYNPSGVFDQDRYLLCIVASASITLEAAADVSPAAADISAAVPDAVATAAGITTGLSLQINGVDTGETVASLAPLTMTGNVEIFTDDSLVFIEATLNEFESDVNAWISCAQGAACVQLDIQDCNSTCTRASETV